MSDMSTKILLVMAGLAGATMTWYGTQMICDKGSSEQLLAACKKIPLDAKKKQTATQRSKECELKFKKGGFGSVAIGQGLKYGGCVAIIIFAILIGMMGNSGY
jgi:hypothetical protein